MSSFSRRRFLIHSLALSATTMVNPFSSRKISASVSRPLYTGGIVISTWDFGLQANEQAWKILASDGRSIDAIEQGIRVVEADPHNHSVGLGGFPDRDGHVTLDACIMDEEGRAGSVAFLESIVHPVSVARLVMEKTPHVMLTGKGALQFALANGFQETNLLTDEARKEWELWKKSSKYQPVINIENHDTIGMLSMDVRGNLSGGCSTSGLAYKMHGRVGDSPIIGAAVTTGLGEMVMRSLSSFLVVELMRQGLGPQEACQEAISRIIHKNKEYSDNQVGIIALTKSGSIGAFAIQDGFTYAVTSPDRHEIIGSDYFLK
jgi:isoaspartyl peptidase/L-asparaginase-like protein (Ntn-hydrolase superfamily)